MGKNGDCYRLDAKRYAYERFEKKKTEVIQKGKKILLRVGFEPTPFRTRTLIWRLRPTRPSQPSVVKACPDEILFTIIFLHERDNNASLPPCSIFPLFFSV